MHLSKNVQIFILKSLFLIKTILRNLTKHQSKIYYVWLSHYHTFKRECMKLLSFRCERLIFCQKMGRLATKKKNEETLVKWKPQKYTLWRLFLSVYVTKNKCPKIVVQLEKSRDNYLFIPILPLLLNTLLFITQQQQHT